MEFKKKNLSTRSGGAEWRVIFALGLVATLVTVLRRCSRRILYLTHHPTQRFVDGLASLEEFGHVRRESYQMP